MSILKKNALALAVIAAAGFAASAGAYTVRTDADTTPEGIARQAGTTVTMTQLVNVQIELGDALIGRTTGFQARITLLPILELGELLLAARKVRVERDTRPAGDAARVLRR